MLKVLKRYTMPLKRTPAANSQNPHPQSPIMFFFVDVVIPGFDVIFSSYPGTLHSIGSISYSIIDLKSYFSSFIDDFYMADPSKLTVIETTIGNYNKDLYRNMSPISVPEWMRIVVANRLANSGKEWVDQFFTFNDGTYNNEWMITDFKQFIPGTPPKPG
jgi:hypothetical protein